MNPSKSEQGHQIEKEANLEGTPIEVLEFPDSKLNQFRKKKIETVEQLLTFYPRKYYDFRKPTVLSQVQLGEPVAMVLKVVGCRITGKLTIITAEDEEGNRLAIKHFDLASGKRYKHEKKHIVCGIVTIDEYYKVAQMVSPLFVSREIDVYPEETEKYLRIIPVYSGIKGMSNEYIQKAIQKALDTQPLEDFLSVNGRAYFRVIGLVEKYRVLHSPNTLEEINEGKRRDAFDELFSLATEINEMQRYSNQKSSFILEKTTYAKRIVKTLPFELTQDQKETLKSIVTKIRKGIKTQSMVMGDVGSGKTIVAILLMLSAAENGFQSVLMAPTGVLANQHYEEVKTFADQIGLEVVYLCSGMKVKEKREALKKIATGKALLIVGTHAAISDSVEYHNLGLVAIDEQHRFGVKQREALEKRNKKGIHVVDFTATPIPRSLAITIYGEGSTDIYTIKTKPAGRKKIETYLTEDEQSVYNKIKEEVKKGHQAYVVCPLIDPSDCEALGNVESATETFKKLQKLYQGSGVRVGITTGKMDRMEMDEELLRFKNKEYDVLVSTTIIEVGVNVPNATIIVIKNAERFGLAQLHQLRGRVGRSDLQSYCYLISRAQDNEKLKAMTQTNDGFKISEKDLEIRGAGEFLGIKQSGDNKKLELALRCPNVFGKIKALLLSDKERKIFFK